MLYRINLKNFLVHAIDWLPVDQLNHIQYALISAQIPNGSRASNVVRLPFFWPPSIVMEEWEANGNKEAMREIFLNHLRSKDDPEVAHNIQNSVYQAFLNPINLHNDVMIMCHEDEDPIIDVVCEFLKKDFALEAIDLNQLFTTGHAGPYHIDRNKIWDKSVDVRRWAAKEMQRALASTYEGKARVIRMMTKKEKLKKFDELGLDPAFIPKNMRDQILLEEWDKADREGDLNA